MYYYSINTYECWSKPKVISTVSINDWLSQIKHSNYSDLILKARNGLIDYDSTKAKLPCATYNFLFKGYKKDYNITTSSGLIYIDVDNPLFDISTLDLSKVYSYYKSFGGNGYAILVKVSGLTATNFKSTYTSITDNLGITSFVDKQAIKTTQFNVLSYDKDIFINTNSYTFPSVEFATQSIVIQKKEETYTIERGAESRSIRFDNLNEITIVGDYVVNWDGYDYIRCFIPMKKVDSYRNNFLLSYCNNLVYLNPTISWEQTVIIIKKINNYACTIPVDDEQIKRVVNSIHNYNKEGKLKPIYYWKKRKIVFDKLCKLKRDEKLEICRAELAIRATQKSKKKIYHIIENWDFKTYGAITQRKMYKHFPISKKTVEKYWSEFKDFAKSLKE